MTTHTPATSPQLKPCATCPANDTAVCCKVYWREYDPTARDPSRLYALELLRDDADTLRGHLDRYDVPQACRPVEHAASDHRQTIAVWRLLVFGGGALGFLFSALVLAIAFDLDYLACGCIAGMTLCLWGLRPGK